MKKLFLLLMAVTTGALTAHADDTVYSYLTFETTSGAKASVPVASLEITVTGSTLTAGDKTFSLSNLSKMYFTPEDVTTGISTVSRSEWAEASEIYDLNGRRVAKSEALKGAFILRSKNGTYKLAVR